MTATAAESRTTVVVRAADVPAMHGVLLVGRLYVDLHRVVTAACPVSR